MSRADAPCGAAESTSQCGAVPRRSIDGVERHERLVSGYAGARCGNVFATGSPAWLDDTTPPSVSCGCACDEAQELAGDVAGAAEHDRGIWCFAALMPLAFASLAPRPMLGCSRSPSSAECVIALIAATFERSLMMSMPTWLSVAGPEITVGSMPNSSRSSFAPPQAPTGIVRAQHHAT